MKETWSNYSYDANGNLTQRTLNTYTDTYAYNVKNQLTSYSGYDGYQQRYTYNAQGHMTKRESKGSASRTTLEAIATSAGEAAAEDGGSDDPDPYANAATSDSWSTTTYVYDITAPYYEALTETTSGVTTAYEYGAERISAYQKIGWSTLKTDYVYDGRGSVAQELTYNSSWYTLGGFLSNKGVNSYTYTPFGELLTGEGSGYRFNGEYYDSATGMLNLRARQYEPAVMRFSQRDVWHGRIKTPTTQNRYLYCINDPIGYYDRSGKRVEEGAGKTVTITTSKTPVASTMPTSAYTMAQIARAEAAGNTGIDKTNLTAAQKKIVEAAEKTLREKALSGTLTASERARIVQSVCSSVQTVSETTIAEYINHFLQVALSEFRGNIEFREEIETYTSERICTLNIGQLELFSISRTITAGSYQNIRKENSPDFNLVFLTSAKGMGVGSSFYYNDYFSSLVYTPQALSVEFGIKDNSYGLSISMAGDKMQVSIDTTIYNGYAYERSSTVVTSHNILIFATVAGIAAVVMAPEISLPAIGGASIPAFADLAYGLIP